MKYTQNRIFFSDAYITLPAICAFASAVVLVVSAFVGSWLSLRDSMCLQGWVRQFLCVFINVSVFDQHIIKRVFFLQFVLLLVLVFCLESTASALAYFHTKNVCKLHTHTQKSHCRLFWKQIWTLTLCVLLFCLAGFRNSSAQWNVSEIHRQQSGRQLSGCGCCTRRGVCPIHIAQACLYLVCKAAAYLWIE